MDKKLIILISVILIISFILLIGVSWMYNLLDYEDTNNTSKAAFQNIRFGYPQSGIYKRKLQKARELGIKYLKKMEKMNYGDFENPAVMFDIDETLSYYGVPLMEIIDIAKYAKSRGLLIVIITARPTSSEAYSKEELKEMGINYDYMFHMRKDEDISTYKKNTKARLKKNNKINIIMSIGDNIIDIDGIHSGYSIKLPNSTSNDDTLWHLNKNSNLVPIM